MTLLRIIDLTCNKCGAQLKANADLKKCSCNYCGNEMLIDDEVIHHQIDNAFDAGYQAEIGRQQAQLKTTLQQARNAIEIGDYKTAYELYKSLLLIDTTNNEALFYVAICDYMLHIGDYNAKDQVYSCINKLGIKIMNSVGADNFRNTFSFFSIEINTEVWVLNDFIQHINKYTEAELYFIGNVIYKTATIILDYRDMLNNNEQAEQINQLIANTVLQLKCRDKIYSRGLILDRMKTQCNYSPTPKNVEIHQYIERNILNNRIPISSKASLTKAAILQILALIIMAFNIDTYSVIVWVVSTWILITSIKFLIYSKKDTPLKRITSVLLWLLAYLNSFCTLGILIGILLK